MTKAIFFDWDGTLVDSLEMLISAHNHVRTHYGLKPWSNEEFFGAVTYSSRELFPILYGDKSDEAQVMLFAYIREHHLKHVTAMDGAKDLLDFLRGKNIPMAVISNKRDEILRREVEHFGWQDYFGVYMGAGVAIKDKPSAAPIFHALAHHPAKPDLKDLLYVGDTETDLRTCAEAGCDCAYIRQEGRSGELIEIHNPLIVVDNLFELRTRLEDLLA